MKYCINNILFTCLQKTVIILLLTQFLFNTLTFGQSQRYTIEKAPFSTRTNAEFSPVFYLDGIVFCSNQRDNSLAGYKDEQSRLFKLFYTSKSSKSGWNKPKILAKELTTGFHDGPVTFNKDGTILYYSRNNLIENSWRNITDSSNKLGIYSAELLNGTWTNIKPFTYNNPLYSFSTPALTTDGKRIYFSSDMPGGFGGMDLYYCNRIGNDWHEPINMGPVINTPGNESFPFADKYGKVYFASDGHKGFGGKDLYFTIENNGEWLAPIHLDSAINSIADDFALVMDSTSLSGYFSTNRLKTDDIFSFSTVPEDFSNCDTIKENNYCFTFYDERYQLIDTLPAIYRWDFGNGIIRTGTEVKHCFPGPGDYSIRLIIIDEITGDTIAEQVEYNVQLDNFKQAYIHSNNIGMVNQPMTFDALESNLKDVNITDYFWDFGDGFKPGGPVMNKTFEKNGEYTVRLGLLATESNSGVIQKTCAIKKIRIYNTSQELALPEKITAGERNGTMQINIKLMDDISKMQKRSIEEAFKETIWHVGFDKFGIMPESYPFLDKAVAILKNNPKLRLEIVIYASEEKMLSDSIKISDKWAQELGFYFRDKGIDTNVFRSTSAGLSHLFMQSNIHKNNSVEGVIEFIYMKM
jgi:outer membrane protein OmpA-like peptidoglycan-associated protein